MDIKHEYEILSKKYKLPHYDELDKEFELLYFQDIIEIKYPLRFVRRRIVDKLAGFVHFFQNVLSPIPGNLIAMEENAFLSKEDKDEVAKMMKGMIALERESLVLDVNNDEKKDAEFIKMCYSKWKNHKDKIVSYVNKLEDGWKQEIKQEESGEHYFG